jgi:RND superfamily putative drug exporter
MVATERVDWSSSHGSQPSWLPSPWPVLGGDYRQDYLQPGSESRAASDTLQQSFPQRSGATIQVVISSASGITAPDVQDRAEKLFADVARSEHVVRVTSPFSAEGAGQVAEDTRTAYAVVALNKTDDEFTPAEAKALVEPILGAGDATLRVEVGGAVAAKSKSVAIGSEGIGLMQRRSSCSSSSAPQSRWACPCSLPSSGSASRWRSASCFAAWSTCRLVVERVAMWLGVGIDYALFIVTRFRSSLAEGQDPRRATVTAVSTRPRGALRRHQL